MTKGFWSRETMRALIVVPALMLGAAGPAAAQTATPQPASAPTAAQKAAAAAAFDEGVKRFEHADYGPAATSFLRADEILPNPDAITNAIAAARRGNDHLLVAQAAERGIQRAEPNSPLAVQAREALSQAARNLSRLEIDCEPIPCSLALDGQSVKSGGRYVLPGTHSGVVTSPDGARADDAWDFVAGATYRVTMQLPKPGQTAVAPSRTETTASADGTVQPGVESGPEDHVKRKPLPPAAFFVAGGVTVVLAGVLTWSGLNALSKGSDYKDNPRSDSDKRDVESAETRSNILFGATLVAAGATAAMGIFFVDWSGKPVSAGVAPMPGGAFGSLNGRF
jgi:hypothetical protein